MTTRDEFYVGYLPLPAKHRRTLRVVVPLLLVLCGGAAGLVAALQRDPGAAEWREEVVSVRGVLLAEPYPLILTEAGEVVLLVEQGKHGARANARAALVGQMVTARGVELRREGRRVLELVEAADALQAAADGAAPPPLPSSTHEAVTVRGEIIDSKCYHGAMKPGEGKTHKACATVCISNGIPAMFIAQGGGAYLLSTGGEVIDADTLSKIGEPVEVTGETWSLGTMRVLRIEPGSAKRLER